MSVDAKKPRVYFVHGVKISQAAVQVLGILSGYREPVPAAQLDEQYFGHKNSKYVHKLLPALESAGLVDRIPVLVPHPNPKGSMKTSYHKRYYQITTSGRKFYAEEQHA